MKFIKITDPDRSISVYVNVNHIECIKDIQRGAECYNKNTKSQLHMKSGVTIFSSASVEEIVEEINQND